MSVDERVDCSEIKRPISQKYRLRALHAMNTFIFIGIVSFVSSITLFAQGRIKEIPVDGGCNYIGHIEGRQKIFTFGSTAEAEQVVDRIVKHSGIVRNFLIMAADVGNAQAIIDKTDGKRYILYSQEFMERVRDTTQTNWAEISIIAHEIGHHLNGHTLEGGGSRPALELEADQYSGFVLRMMNSSLAQAQSALNAFGSDEESSTHPRKKSRLAAIRFGWSEADNLLKQPGRPTAPSNPVAATNPQKLELHAENTAAEVSKDWWSWTVYIEGPSEALDQIKCVEYTLHPTFVPQVVQVCDRGTGLAFALNREGWGTFRIDIRILLKSGQSLRTYHDLRFR